MSWKRGCPFDFLATIGWFQKHARLGPSNCFDGPRPPAQNQPPTSWHPVPPPRLGWGIQIGWHCELAIRGLCLANGLDPGQIHNPTTDPPRSPQRPPPQSAAKSTNQGQSHHPSRNHRSSKLHHRYPNPGLETTKPVPTANPLSGSWGGSS